MEKGRFVGTLYMFAMATALISSAEAMADMSARVTNQSVMTPCCHEELVKYYENAASDLQTKAQKKTQLLEQYQSKSYLYGRQAQDLQAQTHALIRKYDRAAKVKMGKAAEHRQMAAELEENTYCVSPKRVVNC
ncbi:hypothetical protein [Nitrosospira briensis]|uniref:hypothetical protein n=1 Tax=Nitrosospira briensis TaxID=35799 RepID=UPI0004694892|nr:hypothetical protein [Nitrosospira briensis]